jgi:hypothetical protein
LGPDGTKDLNYKRAMNEVNDLESPAIKQTLEQNLLNLDRFKVNTSKAGTYINLEEGAKTGIYSTNNFWASYLDHAQTEDLGSIDPNANQWIKNFNWNPTIIGYDDASAQIKENNKTGTSTYNYENSFSKLNDFAQNEMAGILKVTNANAFKAQSNTNKFGEKQLENGDMPKGKDGKPLPLEPGQLDYAHEENQRQAFQRFNLTSKINAGLFQDFAQRTAGYIPSANAEMSSEAHAFKNRMDIGLTPEQSNELNGTLDGYYYKKGTIVNGVDVSGQLNTEILTKDFKEHANGILAREYGVAAIEIKDEKSSQDFTIYNQNPEQTKSYNATKEAEAFAAAALQAQTTITSTYDQGYSDEDMLKLLGSDAKDESVLGGIVNGFKEFLGFGDGSVSSQTTVNDATFDQTSPFTTIVGSDGQTRHVPKNAEDWNVEEYRAKMWNKVKNNNPDWTDKDVENEVNKRVNAATKLLNNATQRRYSESGMGEQRTEMTQLEWTSQRASPGFIQTLQNAWFGKDATGGIFGKKANEVLGNVDIKVGETTAEGRSFLGNIPIVQASNNLILGAFSYASNCGFRTEKKITLDGREIPAGSFVHMSKLDGVSKEKINELVGNKSIFIGSGYWTKDGSKDGQNPDRTSVVGMGANGKEILDAVNSQDRNNPQATLTAAAGFYSTITAGGDYNMVIKELENKTFKLDVPQYAIDPAGKSALDFAQQVVNKVETKTQVSNTPAGVSASYSGVDPVKVADNLALVGKNRQEFLAAAKGKEKSEIAKLGGKYYGQQTNASKNWNMQPVVRDTPIIEKGVVNQAFKNTVGWQETGSGSFWGGNGTRKAYFNVDVNVTQAMHNSNDKTVRVSAQKSLEKYYDTDIKMKTGNIKDPKGKVIIPNINARK